MRSGIMEAFAAVMVGEEAVGGSGVRGCAK